MGTIWHPDISARTGPKYKALAGAIREAVEQQQLKPGEKLPPVRDLAWEMKITPGTVARAYSILTDQGVLEAAVGRGTFVAGTSKPDTPAVTLPALEIDAFPHNSSRRPEIVNLISPALPNVGQSLLIKELMGEVARDPASGIMHYPSRDGFQPAREAVLHWLHGTPLGDVDQSDLVLAHGGQNGICLALQAILQGARPTVLVEDLAYPGFRRAAGLLRAQVREVSMDQHGIRPDSLAHAARDGAVQALCTSAEVHNPTGRFTPEARRAEIADLARQHDFQIIEDDCYRLGRTRASSYRMLVPERGWYVGSISKVLTPALRIGFTIAPKPQAHNLRRAVEHGFFGMATPLADLSVKLLSDPRSLEARDKIGEEVARFVEVCVNHLGGFDLTWRKDMLFVWLRLPEGWRATGFCQAAEAAGIQIRPAEDFASREANAPHAVRIAINAQIALDHFDAAMMRLRDLLDNPPERIGV